jgi:hypothetical protein
MTDYYLKFTSEAQANEALCTLSKVFGTKIIEFTEYLVQGELDEDGDTDPITTENPKEGAIILETYTRTMKVSDRDTLVDLLTPKFHNASTIGIVYKATGALDTEGNPVMQPTEGWHVNVRTTEDVPELEQYRTYPSTPIRVWG